MLGFREKGDRVLGLRCERCGLGFRVYPVDNSLKACSTWVYWFQDVFWGFKV